MANNNVYISEFAQLPFINGHPINIVEMPPIAVQNISVGASHVESSVFQNNTRMIRVQVDNSSATNLGVAIKVGTAPVAAATDTRLAPNQTEYFFVQQGINANKLSAIQSTV